MPNVKGASRSKRPSRKAKAEQQVSAANPDDQSKDDAAEGEAPAGATGEAKGPEAITPDAAGETAPPKVDAPVEPDDDGKISDGDQDSDFTPDDGIAVFFKGVTVRAAVTGKAGKVEFRDVDIDDSHILAFNVTDDALVIVTVDGQKHSVVMSDE